MGRVSIEHGAQAEMDDGVVIDDAVANKFIGGWKVSAIWTEQSGFPLILNTSVVGGGNRVNLVPGVDPVIHGSRSNVDRVKEWFNIDAFATPPAYTYGTVRRTFTQVRGPGVQNVDASLLKEPASSIGSIRSFELSSSTSPMHRTLECRTWAGRMPDSGRSPELLHRPLHVRSSSP